MSRAFLIVLAFILSGCGSPAAIATPGPITTTAIAAAPTAAPTPTPTPRVTPAPTPTPFPLDVLDQAVIAFEGSHSRGEIQAALDEAFALYGLEKTDENYSRAGSVLVGLRKHDQEQGCDECTEMAILRETIDSGLHEFMEFHEAAAWTSSSMVLGIE